MMQLIGQRDPRWSFKTIGNSKTTIGAMGCTISCVSMLSDFYGCFVNPGWLAKNLSFAVDKILWNSITDKTCFKFIWRFYTYDEKQIVEALNGKTTSCLLEIRHAHWVVGIKKLGSYYLVADPWQPSRHLYHKSYISGGARFDKK